jgi:hypothetical protein
LRLCAGARTAGAGAECQCSSWWARSASCIGREPADSRFQYHGCGLQGGRQKQVCLANGQWACSSQAGCRATTATCARTATTAARALASPAEPSTVLRPRVKTVRATALRNALSNRTLPNTARRQEHAHALEAVRRRADPLASSQRCSVLNGGAKQKTTSPPFLGVQCFVRYLQMSSCLRRDEFCS